MKIKKVPFWVMPALPEMLNPVRELALNQWFCWNQQGLRLFRHMDRDLWEEVGHNPVSMISKISQSRIMDLLEDEGFLSQMEKTYEVFKEYMSEKGVYSFLISQPIDFKIGYFSMEYGITESMPIYSGGLGILAGDHLKSASDLRLPLVGVGLMYKHGYFTQMLNVDGWQQEKDTDNDFYHMSLTLEKDSGGNPIRIPLRLAEREIKIQIWRSNVGRVPLYLLDSNISDNNEDDRQLTANLYGGNEEYRLKQEIILGIGGIRALKAIGINPIVYHMNEGHSFLVGLERIRSYIIESGLDYQSAFALVRSSTVFTTHTPVPAGNDVFNPGLAEKYIRPYVDEIGVVWSDFMKLGRQNIKDSSEPFGATVFALKTSEFRNGVSKLHGEVSRNMWKDIWRHVTPDEVPISSVTNGIHIPSWISAEMADLFDRYLGPEWKEDPDSRRLWERIDDIPDTELWYIHERRRRRLVEFARRRLIEQLKRQGANPREVEMAKEVLMPDALTIGFARRMATYKRGLLIFKDIERLKAILSSKERPVQLIVSGKAHPRDTEGKEIIQRIIHASREDPFRNKIVFLEDYNMNSARYLVQGVDIWLNNPRRPFEACGTSGMKATANGALNLSIQDGWWDEGYAPGLGWSIGKDEKYENCESQDIVESKAIYDLLEREIIPIFYERGLDGLPRGWISMMKKSMRTLCPAFNSNRMVEEYTDRCYMEAALNYKTLSAGKFKVAKDIIAWRNHLLANWESVRVIDMRHEGSAEVKVDSDMVISAKIQLGAIDPSHVSVRVYYGLLDEANNLTDSRDLVMEHNENLGEGLHHFRATLTCEDTGKFGYTVRIIPRHEHVRFPVDIGLIRWAEE